MGRTQRKLEIDYHKLGQSRPLWGCGPDKCRGFSKKSRRVKHHRHREENRNITDETEYAKYHEFKRVVPKKNPKSEFANIFWNIGIKTNWKIEDNTSLIDQLERMQISEVSPPIYHDGYSSQILPTGMKRIRRRGNLKKFLGWNRPVKEKGSDQAND
jgi:hypothetical protein